MVVENCIVSVDNRIPFVYCPTNEGPLPILPVSRWAFCCGKPTKPELDRKQVEESSHCCFISVLIWIQELSLPTKKVVPRVQQVKPEISTRVGPNTNQPREQIVASRPRPTSARINIAQAIKKEASLSLQPSYTRFAKPVISIAKRGAHCVWRDMALQASKTIYFVQ